MSGATSTGPTKVDVAIFGTHQEKQNGHPIFHDLTGNFFVSLRKFGKRKSKFSNQIKEKTTFEMYGGTNGKEKEGTGSNPLWPVLSIFSYLFPEVLNR